MLYKLHYIIYSFATFLLDYLKEEIYLMNFLKYTHLMLNYLFFYFYTKIDT